MGMGLMRWRGGEHIVHTGSVRMHTLSFDGGMVLYADAGVSACQGDVGYFMYMGVCVGWNGWMGVGVVFDINQIR